MKELDLTFVLLWEIKASLLNSWLPITGNYISHVTVYSVVLTVSLQDYISIQKVKGQ